MFIKIVSCVEECCTDFDNEIIVEHDVVCRSKNGKHNRKVLYRDLHFIYIF